MEFYIKTLGDPNFDPLKLENSTEISGMLAQIETVLFTRKGDVLGDPDFGANLNDYVYSLSYNDYLLKNVVIEQIYQYVPLAQKYQLSVEVDFTQEVDRHLVFINIVIDNKYQLGVYV
jgi:hypothetical protein|tara:strand:- start:723 stop:1076 length:354 start_codon:yes stop_codon:yes gene_type:complete